MAGMPTITAFTTSAFLVCFAQYAAVGHRVRTRGMDVGADHQAHSAINLNNSNAAMSLVSLSIPTAVSPKVIESSSSTQAVLNAGAGHWLEILDGVTFPTDTIELSREEALALLHGIQRVDDDESLRSVNDYGRTVDGKVVEWSVTRLEQYKTGLETAVFQPRATVTSKLLATLVGKIQQTFEKWPQVFVKLSTRSPKDSSIIFAQASVEFGQIIDAKLAGETVSSQEFPYLDVFDANSRNRLFFDLVQKNYPVASGREAVLRLLTSKRVKEDLTGALNIDGTAELNVEMRKYDSALPLESEFRAIAWNGEMHAIWQYYHAFYFAELQVADLRRRIQRDILRVFDERKDALISVGLGTAVIDFSWQNGQVSIIEVNPFDPASGIGINKGSMGLFDWELESDQRFITMGPLDFRIRQAPMAESVLRSKLNQGYFRNAVFPSWGSKYYTLFKNKKQ